MSSRDLILAAGPAQGEGAPARATGEEKKARRPRLGRARQADRHDVDPCRRGHQAFVYRKTRRPCRHARSAGVRLPADRARRSDQDRPVRVRQPQDLRIYVRWGEERDTDDSEGRVVERSDVRPDAAAIERYCRVHRHHRTGAAALFRNQDRRRAGLRSRARRRNGGNRAAPGNHPLGSCWSRRRMRITQCSRRNAAREPTYARSRATSAGCSGHSAMWPRCAAARSGRSANAT